MRDFYIRDELDKAVFNFINSAECKHYSDLIWFLEKNSLPLRESWTFYFLGKEKAINEKTFTEPILRPNSSYNSYGIYVHPEFYYWALYMNNAEQEKADILDRLKLQEKDTSQENIEKYFIKSGWGFVDDKIKGDASIAEEEFREQEEEFRNSRSYANDREPWEEKYCEVCESSPCMCSDPERTSTTYEE